MGRFNSLPKWYLDTESGRTALAEANAAHLAERQKLREEVERIRTDAEKRIPKLEAAMREARARALESAEKHRKSLQALAEAEAAHRTAAQGSERRIAQLEAELRRSADPLIDAFIEQLHEEHQNLRDRIDVVLERAEYGKPDRSGRRNRVSNKSDIDARLVGIIDAIRAAERLRLEVGGEDLPARLEKLRARLPEIRHAEEFIPQ